MCLLLESNFYFLCAFLNFNGIEVSLWKIYEKIMKDCNRLSIAIQELLYNPNAEWKS